MGVLEARERGRKTKPLEGQPKSFPEQRSKEGPYLEVRLLLSSLSLILRSIMLHPPRNGVGLDARWGLVVAWSSSGHAASVAGCVVA